MPLLPFSPTRPSHDPGHEVQPGLPDEARFVDDTLIDRIKWTTLARVVLLTAVLGFAVAMDVGMGPQPASQVPETTLYQLTSAFYFLSFFVLLATQLSRQKPRGIRVLAVASVAVDAALALALVGVTDGLHSVFLFAFPLAVLNSALLLYRTGAMAAATAAAVGLYAMGAMELGWLPLSLHRYRVAWLRTTVPHAPMSPLDVAVLLLVQTAAVYGTALLASNLVLELDKARRRSKREQHELETLRVRYDDVVTSMPDGILTVSAVGVVTSANPAALTVLDLPAPSVVSRPLTEVLPALKRDDFTLEHEIQRQLTGGRSQVLACRMVPLRGVSGEGSPGTLVVFRDLTDERAKEEKHRHHERLAAIGAMAAAVAHEIRNPLASISGAVQMLETSDGLQEMDRKLMEIVVRETHQLSAWIGEFLDFARPRPLQVGPCDLRRIALDTLEACAQDPHVAAAGIELRQGPGLRETPEDPRRMVVTGDALLLRQAIWNLLVNATQAVLAVERRAVELDLVDGLDSVEVSVGDSGPGVDPADIAHVFEPFYTTKGEGTGLGLATVQRHVTAHRGSVRVDRSSLGGARFVMTLPRRPGGTFSAQRPLPVVSQAPE